MDNSKKYFLWGVVGVIVILAAGLYVPLMKKNGETSGTPTVPAPEAVIEPTPSAAPAGVPVVKKGAKIVTPESFWREAVESPNPGAPSIGIYIVPQKLGDAIGGEPYSGFIVASGDPAKSLEWKIVSGSLPPGITSSHSIDCSNVKTAACRPSLQISGTPQVGGAVYTFRAAVSDGRRAIYKDFSLTVAVAPNLKITTVSLPAGLLAENYLAEVAGSGGAASYSWAVRSGRLPPGLTIGSVACKDPGPCKSPGVISGRPGERGTFTFGVVLSSAEETVTKDLTITVK